MPQELSFGRFVLRVLERQLLQDGAPVRLGARAFDILAVLASRPGEVVTKAQLFDAVWPGLVVEENNVQVHISTLRKLLGPDSISTVAGQGYRFTAAVTRAGHGPADIPVPLLSTDRSVAVLPFTNLSEDPEQEYFSEGLAEDIIAKLARSSWIFVIPRHSSFGYRSEGNVSTSDICKALGARYLVTGTVRRSSNVLRITAELVDGIQNETLWSQRFDRPIADLFEVQNKISTAIASAVEPEYLRREEHRTLQNGTELLEHWELLMRARWHMWRSTREHSDTARACLEKALAIKPDDSSTLALMAIWHLTQLWAGWAKKPKDDVWEANRLALRAVRLNDSDSYAHFTLGCALSFTGSLSQAIAEQEWALTLYPQFAAAAGELGRLLAFSGRTQEAVEYILQAIDASPGNPHLSLWVRSRAVACYVDGDYNGAVKYALQAVSQRPDLFFHYYMLAAAQAATGMVSDGRKTVERVAIYGPYSLSALRFAHPFTDERVFQGFADHLRSVGWSG